MKTTTIREIPDETYELIVKKAKKEHRSINSQFIVVLIAYAEQLRKEQEQEIQRE